MTTEKDGSRDEAWRGLAFLQLVRWRGALGKDGLDEGDGFKYILVMMDGLSNFVWLEPTESCTAASTAKHLLRWCKT